MTAQVALPTIRIGNDADETVAARLLKPLIAGQTVMLRITDDRLPKKKRITTPVLILVPGKLLGQKSSTLLVSMPGYGSEVVDTKEGVTMTHLIRVGVRPTLAKALAVAINQVFIGEGHGT